LASKRGVVAVSTLQPHRRYCARSAVEFYQLQKFRDKLYRKISQPTKLELHEFAYILITILMH